jgi:glyoxylase-like metal-dependent hydrolase (beta-lactamase superfamily II)
MLRRTLAVIFVAASTVALAAVDQATTLSERSYKQARAVLDRAVEAAGGAEALRAIKSVRLELEGETFTRLQMPTPEAPFEGGTLKETLLLDLENNRMRLDQKNDGAGFEGDATVTIGDGEGATYDHRAKTTTPIPAEQSNQQQFIQYYRRVPSLLLLQALSRTTSLRYLGEDNFEGRKHDVVTFVMPDTVQVAMFVDAKTSLVSKYELMFVDPFTGDEASEILYGAYKKQGVYQVPTTFTNVQAGDAVTKLKVRVEFNPTLTDASFRFDDKGYKKVEPVPANLEETVETLAPGVIVVQNIAGQNQNTMFVEFADHLVAIEAPGTSDGSDGVIKRVKALFPNKPIRYVVMTHHHGDHIGGLRSYIAEGATVITTPGNRGVVERTAKAPQNDRLSREPREPVVETIEGGKRVLSDATRTLELIDIGPNPHAKELVIAWLPAEKVVFQGDMFFVPQNNAPFGPPQESKISFAKKLRELKLPVERIASVHGATATIEQFNENTASVQ